jgi:uncharacterized protein
MAEKDKDEKSINLGIRKKFRDRKKIIKDRFISYFKEVLELKTDPHDIALGFAVGTFIAIIPTPGFNVFIALLVILIIKRISKVSMLIALAIWNPFTVIPIYALVFKLANSYFFTVDIVLLDIFFIDMIYNISRRYIFPLFIVSSAISILSYFIVLFAFMIKRRKIE